jgi:hypothetical protein
MVEHLPRKLKALSSNPRTRKKKIPLHYAVVNIKHLPSTHKALGEIPGTEINK